jgi:hypothetical protein
MSETLQARVLRLFDAARLREDRVPRYGFSNADGCARAQVYAFHEFEKTGALKPTLTHVRWNFTAAHGQAVGDFLERAARRLGDATQVRAKLKNDLGLDITGTSDWVTPTHIIDFKRADDATWRKVQEVPAAGHVLQVNGYAVALERPFWGLLYVRNVTKGEELPFVLHEGAASPDKAQEIVEHWATVDFHRKCGTLPDRPFHQDSFECHACRSRDECWREP